MKLVISPVCVSLRWLAVISLLLVCIGARADEYTDVSQLVRSNKLAEALARADQFLVAQPKDPQMRFIKGVIQRDSGKIGDAIATFTKLTEDYPELPEPYNNLAVLYAGQSQFDKARSALEMAIRTNPSYATAHENLGDIYAKLASQAYNKALQLDNGNQALPPKLALIREIFTPATAKPARPAPGTQPQAQPPVVVSTAPATKPAPTPLAAPPAPSAPSAPPAAVTQPVAKPVPPEAKPATATAPATVPVQPLTPAPGSTEPEAATAKVVEDAVAAWAAAWSARDVKGYLAAYGKDFDPPGAMSRKTWEDERQLRISSKASISVRIEKLSISVNGTRAVAKFLQDYKAGGLAVSSRKTLDFSKVGEHWLIVKETVGN
jgi:tetratricopeptide (TPR) repeat protein